MFWSWVSSIGYSDISFSRALLEELEALATRVKWWVLFTSLPLQHRVGEGHCLDWVEFHQCHSLFISVCCSLSAGTLWYSWCSWSARRSWSSRSSRCKWKPWGERQSGELLMVFTLVVQTNMVEVSLTPVKKTH